MLHLGSRFDFTRSACLLLVTHAALAYSVVACNNTDTSQSDRREEQRSAITVEAEPNVLADTPSRPPVVVSWGVARSRDAEVVSDYLDLTLDNAWGEQVVAELELIGEGLDQRSAIVRHCSARRIRAAGERNSDHPGGA